MKKAILTIIGILLFVSWANAQVVYNFETGAQGFFNYGWGTGITNVTQIADPTGNSTGALQVTFDGSKGGTGAVGAASGDPAPTSAQVLTYYIWLPQGTPDNLHIQLFAQDNKSWSNKTSDTYWAKDIPKETWFPVNFYLEQAQIKNTNFDVKNNKFGWMGIDIGTWDNDTTVITWTGNILLDNITHLGVQPSVYADFEQNENEFKSLWGTLAGITKSASPSDPAKGSLKVDISGSGGAVGIEKAIDGSKFDQLVHWIWLPSDAPDNMLFKVFAQDNSHWSWNEQDYLAKDIPKGVWYPIYFDMEAIRLKSAGTDHIFDHITYQVAKLGIEIAEVGTYTGTIYLDNSGLIGKEVGDKWVVCTFESPLAGVQGFSIPGFAPAMASIERAVVDNKGVLKGHIDYSKGDKVAVQKDNMHINYPETDSLITGISFDIYLPADLPTGAQIDIVFQPSSNWDWINKTYNVGDGGLVPGEWNKMEWLCADFKDRITDPTAAGVVFIEFKYPANPGWTGDVLFDNLTLLGIKAPEGTLVSPKTTAQVDTAAAFPDFQFAHLVWEDNTLGSETYNVYMSKNPITDLTADDVIQIATGVPHGFQEWAHRPWSTNPEEVTLYFAVTATDGTIETALTDDSRVGPITVTTSATAKAQYVKDFATAFQLDGTDTEFESYKTHQLLPSGAYPSEGWTQESPDLSWKMTFVIDDNYLYMSGDVTDDDLRRDDTQQAWQGDAFELFFGAYDVRSLKFWHPKNLNRSLGDWRIGFNVLGQTCLDGGPAAPVPGVESTVFEKITGDGYIIEAKWALDSLANKDLVIVNGMMMPLKIDNNDWDPTQGDAARSLQAQWGTTGNVDQSWLRPSVWGFLEVIGGPTSVADKNQLPKEFKLYENYPNPFNPLTKIKYDLPKESQVVLKVFDITGKEVATLVNSHQKAGYHEVSFNAANLATGIYIYRISTENYNDTKKMLLLK